MGCYDDIWIMYKVDDAGEGMYRICIDDYGFVKVCSSVDDFLDCVFGFISISEARSYEDTCYMLD